jgi:hypothetical protein
LSAYRSLPVGWSPAPPGFPSDLHMIRKFFARDGLRFGTRMAITAVKFAAHFRRDWSLERRIAEVKEWAARVADPAGRDAIVQMALGEMNRRSYALESGQQLTAGHSQLQARLAVQTAERDAAIATLAAAQASASQEQAELQQHLRRHAHQVRKLQHRITAIKRTWSWRLTRPLRWLARALGR